MSLASLALQLLNGLATASSLFLVAAGLTLIFGVTRIVNFAHGSLYMLGAYLAWTFSERLGDSFGAFALSVLGAAAAIAVLGALIERLLLKRLYDAPELLQLTATFGIVLIVRDAALALWGAEDKLGPRVSGLDEAISIAGHAVPEYDLFVIVVGPLVLVALTWLVTRTRFGVLIRAASENRVLAAALGVRQALLYTAVFALGAFLAALAGALQLPREPANLNMDLAVVAEAFVVTVVGGLGSIPGAFAAALLIGLTKALCIAAGTVQIGGVAIAFPKLTLVVEFIVMAIVLAIKPHGLFGQPAAVPPTTPLPEQRALVIVPGRRATRLALLAFALALLLPLLRDDYAMVLATDVLIAALFAASLQFIMGPGGMTSFGHAAYFGVGAYAAAIAFKHGWPMPAALALAPFAAAVVIHVAPGHQVRRAGRKHDGACTRVDERLPAPPVRLGTVRANGNPAGGVLDPIAKDDVRDTAPRIVSHDGVEHQVPAVGADAGMAAVAVHRASIDGPAFQRDRRGRPVEHVDVGQGIDVVGAETGERREGHIAAVAADTGGRAAAA